ncbi:MAG: hypothetical protein HPY76_07125 [Anaerolineae bacterium]|nr:hypothetical protein [Anaerolineae bacterium]
MSQTGLLLLAILFIIIGVIVGALVASLFADRGKTKRAQERVEVSEDPNRVEMFRVIRDRQDGKLLLEIGGKEYANAQQLPAAVKPALQRLLAELAAWLGLQPGGAAPRASGGSAEVSPPPMRAELPQAPLAERSSAAVDIPSRPLSIVEQINDLLRQRLADSPFRDRGILLMEDPREGVIVWIGMEKFIGIDTVQDDAIRDFIKQVVREWEEKQGGPDR